MRYLKLQNDNYLLLQSGFKLILSRILTAFSDKYNLMGTTFNTKYVDKITTYVNKYVDKVTSYKQKY
jgi:hypothetical protein